MRLDQLRLLVPLLRNQTRKKRTIRRYSQLGTARRAQVAPVQLHDKVLVVAIARRLERQMHVLPEPLHALLGAIRSRIQTHRARVHSTHLTRHGAHTSQPP